MKYHTPILVITLSLIMLFACTESEYPDSPSAGSTLSNSQSELTNTNPPMAVSVALLQQEESYNISHRFIGLVTANQQANLGFERSGKIANILVQVGEQVKKDQILIKLDIDMLQSRQKQIQAQQSKIKAELDLANKKLKRQAYLKDKGFSADANIDDLISQIGVLKASTQELHETLKANLLEQKKSVLTAPYSGLISQRFISLGDIVNVSTPTLTLLSDEKPELHVGIPTKYLPQLTQQDQFEVEIGSQLYLIKRINSGTQVDNLSRTVNLRFALPEDQDWINGQLGYLNFQDPQQSNGFWVPLSALTNGIRGTWNIYVVTQQKDQLSTERRSVDLVYANSHHAYIRGAISHNEAFVTQGLHRIVPGQRISALSEDIDLKPSPPSLNHPTVQEIKNNESSKQEMFIKTSLEKTLSTSVVGR
ncbi:MULTISPECIES: efflux RND transporter periplasmic adaptor subunit [Vibrio]|uniref:Efflux RND transporter periplasmic adaptor subunit n=1 Tax=Vibrio casei TaxID=673372 RepID=A0A368LH99_9VIBR|nr:MULTISPECIES: efflux RND transporter periplasmic adaptor subunit [Vibrio]RCS70041.1 efflux RND transporter periplasmic adaptor subunit [Vibrio casei]SJN33973.1 hypothetical protein FM109_12255 [Vibrio casei]HBV76763.1 efflux RND transporter periplasmic adaptor subunit [Vibrio sp.]